MSIIIDDYSDLLKCHLLKKYLNSFVDDRKHPFSGLEYEFVKNYILFLESNGKTGLEIN